MVRNPSVIDILPSSRTGVLRQSAQRNRMLYAIGLLWGAVLLSLIAIAWLFGIFEEPHGYSYLLPWCFATGIVVGFPIVYQLYYDRFDPFHPIVFASWSYFLPGFFIGGMTLALGISQPYYLAYVLDEKTNLPLSFVYVILGFAGLGLGFLLPLGNRIGNLIGDRFPDWNWSPEQILKPTLVLMMLGLTNMFLAFTFGILGYQKVEEIGTYDGLIYMLSLFWLMSSFVLWLYVFRSEKFYTRHYLILTLLIGTAAAKSAFQGNRGSLITVFFLIAFAYVSAKGKIGLKQTFVGGLLIVAALVIGMVYGTTFRNIKTTQETISIDQYAVVVGDTFSAIGSQNMGDNLAKGFGALGDRLDSISPLAVIVSNYEQLAPLEEAYGFSNNIWNELAVFAIPRVVWPDKPVTIDPAKYGDLYFNYSDNAFAVTPMGDLLRNFGPWGVPLGMIVLGFILRMIYAALRENRPFSFWRSAMFYMLITAVSYEATYSAIIPFLVKVSIIAFGGILIIRFFAGSGRSLPLPDETRGVA